MLLRGKVFWGVLFFGLMAAVAGCHKSERKIVAQSQPRPDQTSIYLLMGFGDREWSGGLDQLAAKLGGQGRTVRVEPYRKWKSIVKEIVSNHPEKVVFVGHSHGGVVAIKAANLLQREGISVRLIVLLDVGRPDPFPANVDFAVHYYVSPPTVSFRRGPRDSLEPGNTHTQLTNVAVGRDGEVPAARELDHMNITDSAALHQMIAGDLARAGG